MAFEIHEREREGIAVFDVTGRLIVGLHAGALREDVEKAVAAKRINILLNLRGVDYIDSTGLGTMVLLFRIAQQAGGALKLLNLNRRELELLVLTKLTTVFDIFNDEQDALNSFYPDREIKRFDILSFIKQTQEEGM
jgi:anti-sigma B factor antagonist